MWYQSAAIAALGVLVAGCAQINVSETVLSTDQKVAMVSTPGDSVSPPTNLVLLSDRDGRYVPVATGFGQAPVPAFLAGAGAGIAVGAGILGAAKTTKSQVTNVSNNSTSTGNVSTQTQQSNIQSQNLMAINSNAGQAAAASNTAIRN
jgi:hypothetical protein